MIFTVKNYYSSHKTQSPHNIKPSFSRPYSELKLKGTFSLAEVHNWIFQCLPEVPEKPQISTETTLFFQSSILNTVLICIYK